MAHLVPRSRRVGHLGMALLAIAWCAMTGGVFGGCGNLFKPATPEAPTERPVVLHYETIVQTLNTMEKGIEAKAGGADAWTGAFDPETYQHVFDERDVTDFGRGCSCTPPTEWGYLAERNAYLYLVEIRPGDSYVASFTSWPEKGAEPEPGDETIIYRRYQITANSPDGNSSQVVANGTVELTFKQISINWLITKWIDHRDDNSTLPDQVTMGMRRLESTTAGH